MITVSKDIRVKFLDHARKRVEAAKAPALTQDLNALAALMTLKELGLLKEKMTPSEASQLAEVLKIAGNASANRQALEKKEEAGGVVNESLANLLGGLIAE